MTTIPPELSADDAEFWEAVRSLPRRQAQVIALRYLDDRSVAGIAEILGTATGTVKKQLHDDRQNVVRRLRLEETTMRFDQRALQARAGHPPRRGGDGDVEHEDTTETHALRSVPRAEVENHGSRRWPLGSQCRWCC